VLLNCDTVNQQLVRERCLHCLQLAWYAAVVPPYAHVW
jgi:hypothetical protein